MSYILYHNPRCSKSRQTLALLEQGGVEVNVIEYLKTPPSHIEIERILQLLSIEPRALMRKGESEYKALNLDDPSLTTTQLIDAMHANPKLIERPILVSENAARIGRPPESVLEIVSNTAT